MRTNARTRLRPSPSPRRPNSNCPEACRDTSTFGEERLEKVRQIRPPRCRCRCRGPGDARRHRRAGRLPRSYPPSGVNLMALISRWSRQMRILPASTSMVPRSGARSTTELLAALLDEGTDVLDGLAHQGGSVGGSPVERPLEAAGLEHLQQLFHQPVQALPRLSDASEPLRRRARSVPASAGPTRAGRAGWSTASAIRGWPRG